MLKKVERDALCAAFGAVLAASASAQNVVTAIFTANAAPVLKSIPTGAPTHAEIANAVVMYCLGDRWARNPSLLDVLLTDLIARGEAGLIPIRDRVRAKVDPNLGVLTTSWITAEKPFFGRLAARGKVQALLDSGEKPILMIQGGTKSGKTYTADWLDFLASEDQCGFRIIIEGLERGSGPSMTPEVLAESLVAKMGRPIETMPTSTSHRYEKRLCNWIVSQALQAFGSTWIVLDGFDDPDLDRGTAALIQELARNMLSGDLNRRVRLVLLDFASNLAQVDELRIGLEGLPDPETVQSSDLKACLQQHFQDIGRTVDDAFLTALGNTLVQDTQTLRAQPQFRGESYLKLLNLKLYALRQQDLERIGRI
jgi:hypothetical protein